VRKAHSANGGAVSKHLIIQDLTPFALPVLVVWAKNPIFLLSKMNTH